MVTLLGGNKVTLKKGLYSRLRGKILQERIFMQTIIEVGEYQDDTNKCRGVFLFGYFALHE
ncbi:MAG: hypothetical protein KDI59_10170 [Xanthomonadales bacterium]|nr:hypothetical protein [Xanthomonadales bacterium]MCB1605004.1 hypothetical protein [Xanthomonadales bacterium]